MQMYCTFGGTSQSLLPVSVTVTKAKRECKNRTIKIAMTEAILLERRLRYEMMWVWLLIKTIQA